jgi:hypothetical protein
VSEPEMSATAARTAELAAQLGASEEPSARTLTGEPIRWSRHWRWRFWDSYTGPEIFRRLEGVAWICPSCGTQPPSIALREYGRNRYRFECRSWKCRWKEEFNGMNGRDLAIELGLEPPSKAPKLPDGGAEFLNDHPEVLRKSPGLTDDPPR